MLARVELIATIVVCTSVAFAEPAANTDLNKLGDQFYLEQARFDPVTNATLTGDNRFDDQLNNFLAPAERLRHFAALHDIQNHLHQLHRDKLSTEDALSYDVLEDQLQAILGLESYPDHLLPLTQMDAIPVELANFGSGQAEQPLATVANYDAYLKRIGKLPQWIDQAIANMQEGMKKGTVESRRVVDATLPLLKGLTVALDKNPFYLPAKNIPASFSSKDQARLKQQFADVVQNKIIPSTTKLAEFFEKQYQPASRTTDGWSALPDGMNWYKRWIRSQTTLQLDPEEIHALGLKEVARIHGELAKLQAPLGYSGDPNKMLEWVRTNKKFMTFKNDAEILNAYRGINEKVKAKLPLLFGHMPKAPLEIREEPELTRAVASDHYSLGSDDGSRPGVFWAVINDVSAYNGATMTSLFLHEGQPGHHFQLSIQQEAALPQFRKRALINSYAEGWALYAETLGYQLGLYDDPVAHAGHLEEEMLRAVRLVVDTGIHAKGWTRDQAIAYMAEHTGESQPVCRAQIERYIAWPGQALGYKLGALKIQELRDRAKQKLGNKFSLAAFHDEVLREGPLPLPVLESYINRWIAAQQAH